MLSLIEAKHKEHAAPHYYLAFIGTEPGSPGNQARYFRHGFEVVGELVWPGGGPPIWPMGARLGNWRRVDRRALPEVTAMRCEAVIGGAWHRR